MDNFDINSAIPMLKSLGISPEQLGPNKLALLQKLAESIDPEKMDAESSDKLLKELGLSFKKKSTTKIGRNELCPCKSGKKYKKCCIDK